MSVKKPVLLLKVKAGMYVLNPDLLGLLVPNQNCDMTQLLIRGLLQNRSLFTFPVHEYWLDVGHVETFCLANGDWH